MHWYSVPHVFEVYFSEYKCFVAYKEKLFKPELMFACEVEMELFSFKVNLHRNTEEANVTHFHEQQEGSGCVLFAA